MAIQPCIVDCVRCGSAYDRKQPRTKLCKKCRKTKSKPYPRTFYINKKVALIRDLGRCQCCGTHESLITHHVDCNKHNSSLSNLITLCNQCHISLHKKYNSLQLKHSNIYNLFPDRFRWGKFGKRPDLDVVENVEKNQTKKIVLHRFYKRKVVTVL